MPFNLDFFADAIKNHIDAITHSDWMGTLITAVVTLAITAVVSILVTRILRKILNLSKNPLPSSSIFINIARVAIWCIGICVVLSSCFNVDISAAITALGVGGIAISLGFQSTLSNLIGGLQISLTKVVEPGEHIKVGDNEGIVHDVTWRHTNIVNVKGERILIPNSIINSAALIKMHERNDVRIDILIKKTSEDISDIEAKIKKDVDKAVSAVTVLSTPSDIFMFGVNDEGYKALLYFTVGVGVHLSKVRDIAVEAIAPYGHRISSSKEKDKPAVIELFQEQDSEFKKKRLKRSEAKAEKKERKTKTSENSKTKKPQLKAEATKKGSSQSEIKETTKDQKKNKVLSEGHRHVEDSGKDSADESSK